MRASDAAHTRAVKRLTDRFTGLCKLCGSQKSDRAIRTGGEAGWMIDVLAFVHVMADGVYVLPDTYSIIIIRP